MADRFFAWNRVGDWPITTNNVRLKMEGIQTISSGGELRTSFGIDSAACFVRLATRASQVLKGGPAQDMYIKNRTAGSNHSAAL